MTCSGTFKPDRRKQNMSSLGSIIDNWALSMLVIQSKRWPLSLTGGLLLLKVHCILLLSLSIFFFFKRHWLAVLLLSALIFIKNSHTRQKLGMNETEGHTKREGERKRERERECVCVRVSSWKAFIFLVFVPTTQFNCVSFKLHQNSLLFCNQQLAHNGSLVFSTSGPPCPPPPPPQQAPNHHQPAFQ